MLNGSDFRKRVTGLEMTRLLTESYKMYIYVHKGIHLVFVFPISSTSSARGFLRSRGNNLRSGFHIPKYFFHS